MENILIAGESWALCGGLLSAIAAGWSHVYSSSNIQPGPASIPVEGGPDRPAGFVTGFTPKLICKRRCQRGCPKILALLRPNAFVCFQTTIC